VFPQRIVCLTEETTETLYLLGEGDRVVGVSGYTVRPPEARQKPRVSAFINANFDKIEALDPDLIFAFSDLQADIAAELIRRGHNVFTFNQRTVDEILQMVLVLGGIVGRGERAKEVADSLRASIEAIRASAATLPRRPRVYFEEWDDPLISGIQWVEELIGIAGGQATFPELASAGLARDRVVDADEVRRRDPEVILASWCGKPVNTSRIVERAGWQDISAVRHGRVHEIASAVILQPGPAALTDGVRQIHEHIARAAGA
jgi:iron complex transport system substrate-binding protein